MRIKKIEIENFLGIQSFKTDITEDICIICGPNACGKSSIQNAIRMALTGQPSRISLKKNYGELVRSGSSQAVVVVSDETETEAIVIKKNGKAKGLPNPGNVPHAMRALLDSGMFSNMAQKEKREFLFGLFDISISPQFIRETLVKRGFDKDFINDLSSYLRMGFPSACMEARVRASESRAAWKRVTGETYGSEKADGWEVAIPSYDNSRIEAIINQIKELTDSVLQNRAKIYSNDVITQKNKNNEERKLFLENEIALLNKMENRIGELRSDYTSSKKDLKGLEDELANCLGEEKAKLFDCPECGATLEIIDALLTTYIPPKGNPERAQELVPVVQATRKRVSDLKDVISKEEARIRTSEKNHKELRELELIRMDMLSGDKIAQLNSDINLATLKLDELYEEKKKLDDLALECISAKAKNRQATKVGADVKAWTELEDVLSPDGLPQELLGGALKQFNSRLKNYSEQSKWGLVEVTHEMEITYDGRSYYLLSASEKWRADAMLTAAIASSSEIGVLMLDCVDVLSLRQRVNLLYWSSVLKEDMQILLFATLKEKPRIDGVQSIWLENGMISEEGL